MPVFPFLLSQALPAYEYASTVTRAVRKPWLWRFKKDRIIPSMVRDLVGR
jgi:hypothetical protein